MVQIKKGYVSFHFVPVYASQALAKTTSPSLQKRMQGKARFNFTSVEPALPSRPPPALERQDRAQGDRGRH